MKPPGSKPIDLKDWIANATATAADSHIALDGPSTQPAFNSAGPGEPDLSRIPSVALASQLHGHGLQTLAALLAPPRFGRARTEIELNLMVERSREIGAGLGLGITGLPPSFSYERRYGETTRGTSTVTVTVESGSPSPSLMDGGKNAKTPGRN